MTESTGINFPSILIGALVGFFFALLGARYASSLHTERERIKDEVKLKHLMYLFVKEIASGFLRTSQYVRQAVIVQISESRLTTFLGASQIEEVSRLGVGGKTVDALYDIYKMFDIIHHQIDKYTSKGEATEFLRIFVFVKGTLKRVKESAGIVTDSAVRVSSRTKLIGRRKLLPKVMGWIVRAREEFLCGVPPSEGEQDHVSSIEALKMSIEKSIAECEEWFDIQATLRVIDEGYRLGIASNTTAGKLSARPGRKKTLSHIIRVYETVTLEGSDTAEMNSGLQLPWLATIAKLMGSLTPIHLLRSNGYMRNTLLPRWKAARDSLSD